MKRITLLLATALAAVLLTALQIRYVRNAVEDEDRLNVVVFKQAFDAGHMITEGDLHTASVPVSMLPGGYGADKKKFEGTYLLRPAYQGEPALEQAVSVTDPFDTGILQADKDHVLIAVKPESDRALAWQVAPGQKVDILFIPRKNEDATPFHLADVTIAGLVDEGFKPIKDGAMQTPVYLLLIVTFEEAEHIAHAKQSGYLEFVRKE